jgi:hypothetical protein
VEALGKLLAEEDDVGLQYDMIYRDDISGIQRRSVHCYSGSQVCVSTFRTPSGHFGHCATF